MTTQSKLPEWTGDLKDDCTLTVGNYRARWQSLQDIACHANGQRTYYAVGHVIVNRLDKEGEIIERLFDVRDSPGLILSPDLARAICEAVVGEALRADEAEAKLTDLVASSANLATSAEKAVLALTKRARAAEKRVRGLPCEDCDNGVPFSADGRCHVGEASLVQCPRGGELAADSPGTVRESRERDRRSFDDVVAEALTGQTDWDAFRSFAATIPDEDWEKLLAARDEE